MLEYIYICRHGFRSNWEDPNIKTGPTGMPRDPPLSAYGVSQSHRLASFLSSPTALAPYPLPERVFSSPFYRCIQTAYPSSEALSHAGTRSRGLLLEHGVSEWYSPVNPDTGLHPRPSDPQELSTFFPNFLDTTYTSTVFPSRSGETLLGLQDRADLFIEAWTSRCESMGLRCVVVFAHAATLIALGRALTGDKYLQVSAGCGSTSLYRRKQSSLSTSTDSRPNTSGGVGVSGGGGGEGIHTSRSTGTLAAASGLLALSTPASPPSSTHSTNGGSGGAKFQVVGESLEGPVVVDGEAESETTIPCGVGEWDVVYTGRADYLERGVERDWSFRDAVIINGQVINDDGDRRPHPPTDTIPTGLAAGMEKHLRRGAPAPNTFVAESITQQSKI